MIVFSRLNTHRLTVQLRELTIDDAIYLCSLPAHLEEYCCTEALRRIVEPATDLKDGQVVDPQLWTVQERAMVIAHYLMHTAEPGNPNFSVGKENTFTDYLLEGVDHHEVLDLGVYEGDHWFLQPLLGRASECIERLIDSGQLHQGRMGWFLGAMACMLVRDKDEDTSQWPEAKYEEYVLRRAQQFARIGDSAFGPLFMLFWQGVKRQDHLLRLGFHDNGIAFDPAPEVPGQSAARFLGRTIITDTTLRILGVPPEPEDGSDQARQPAVGRGGADYPE